MTRKPQAPRRRGFHPGRLLLGLALLLVLLGAGHTMLWRLMTERLEQGFERWAEARRAQGWQVTHAPPRRGGWPLSASLILPALRIAAPPGGPLGGLAWQAAAVRLRIVPPDLQTLLVEAQGPQRLVADSQELPFAAAHLTAALPIAEGASPGSARIMARQLRLGPPAGAVTVAEAEAELEGRDGPALTLALTLHGVALPWNLPLGRQVETASLEAALMEPVPGGYQPARRAAAWRDAGGTLELRALTLRWGEVAASAAATLALDAALQPTGAGTLRVAGAAEGLEALAGAGLLAPRTAGLARSLVPLMARPDPAGGPPQIEVPVTLEDRTLAAARIPVLRLPAIEWGR
ncbi:DUF2125 domain-containing protein [Roseomonas sp. E05]|uniref:DUF2125 domain-containing protein n=1 Tax=Roseomonas sp. E05 TaxID=3046310 RepID=UPI0024BB912E|nr:DUF2125 domain-containing protein [Roseomonas sp. E05]MDJ0386668.1 DUF2125 domain-containing protein [Roseomonas sp. E05]